MIFNKQILSLIFRVIVSGVFFISAISKMISPGMFEIILIDQGLVSTRESAAIIARFLIGAELSIAFLYLQPFFFKSIISPLTLILTSAFTVYLVYLLVVGENKNCGCFGDLVKMNPLQSIFKNIILIGLMIFIHFQASKNNHKFYIPSSVALICYMGIFIGFPIRSNENFPFTKYHTFEKKGMVDLTKGEKLIGVFYLECGHCHSVAREISRLQKKIDLPEIYGLFYRGKRFSGELFSSVTNTSFFFHYIDRDDYIKLIGGPPPRIYWVKDGVVVDHWNKNISKNLREKFGHLKKKQIRHLKSNDASP